METKTNHDYTRRNRFTGETIELTEEEAIKHDQIFYHETLATLEDRTLGTGASKHWDICVSTWIGFVRTMPKHTWSY